MGGPYRIVPTRCPKSTTPSALPRHRHFPPRQLFEQQLALVEHDAFRGRQQLGSLGKEQPGAQHPSLGPQARNVNAQPDAGLQLSIVHALLSLQVTVACVHPAVWVQASVVQALPSLQFTPVRRHVPLSHVSIVQLLLSSQSPAPEHEASSRIAYAKAPFALRSVKFALGAGTVLVSNRPHMTMEPSDFNPMLNW